MQCYHCKHDFCWMCLGDWKAHGSEYYECSRYKENPNIAHESAHAQAREALKKYLHYFERVSTSSIDIMKIMILAAFLTTLMRILYESQITIGMFELNFRRSLPAGNL